MTFAATAGVTYDIAVDGFATTSGPFTGNVSIAVSEVAAPTTTVTRPANDKFAGAKWLTGRSVTVTGRQRERHPRDRRAEDQRQRRREVRLVQLTATGTGVTTITLAGSSFNTLLGVYRGSSVALTLVASNNDAATGITTSKLSFRATKGVTYRIAVDGYNAGSGAASGSIHLQLSGVITTAIAPNASAARPATTSLWNVSTSAKRSRRVVDLLMRGDGLLQLSDDDHASGEQTGSPRRHRWDEGGVGVGPDKCNTCILRRRRCGAGPAADPVSRAGLGPARVWGFRQRLATGIGHTATFGRPPRG